MHITQEIKQEIYDRVDLLHTIENEIDLVKKGSSYIGECPKCGKKKLSVTPSKNIYKCFNCGIGGKNGVTFLVDVMGKDWKETMINLAKEHNIDISAPPVAEVHQESFRNQQLRNSGIHHKNQIYKITDGDNTIELNRYSSGTIDKFENVNPVGDDMLLHYLDLKGNPVEYVHKRKRKKYVRIRYKNPELNAYKGKVAKYRSPGGAKSQIWWPQLLIQAFKANKEIDTLVICEGEKKADLLCSIGIWACAISGIHNFAKDGSMPHDFQLLIEEGKIKNVVFLIDSDYNKISLKNGKSVETRPRSFCSAVIKFRTYFYAYNNQGIHLNIFWGYHKDITMKGIDDLVMRGVEDKKQFAEDFHALMIDREHENEYLQLYNITLTHSNYKIQEYFYLHNSEAFLEFHKKELLTLRTFKFRGLNRIVHDGEIYLAEKVLPHERFWEEVVTIDKKGKERVQISFNYKDYPLFFLNRGFGIHNGQNDGFKIIRKQDKIIQEYTPRQLRRYMTEFAKELENREILALLRRGGKRYLGLDMLEGLEILPIEEIDPAPDVQYMYFKNSYWIITEDSITQRSIKHLDHDIWDYQIIDFEPKLIEQAIKIKEHDHGYSLEVDKDIDTSDVFQFLKATSNYEWRKLYKEVQKGKSIKYVPNGQTMKVFTQEEMTEFYHNVISKLLALGYLLNTHRNYGEMKAIVGMDGVESPVGESNGGTGKSIFGEMIEQIKKTFVVDAKKPGLTHDNFIYDGMSDQTEVIIFDDCRPNLDFEAFFSQITKGVKINSKGMKRVRIDPPKFYFTTNHVLGGRGNSFDRRQFVITFSDFFNKNRNPGDFFGRQLFHNWDQDQWNLYYNIMACAIQVYMRFGLRKITKERDVHRRKLRQSIGENLMEWLNLKYGVDSLWMNKEVAKEKLYQAFIAIYPKEKNYIDIRRFKKKLIEYTQYAELRWNPRNKGEDIKSGSVEYLCIANEEFEINSNTRINANPFK